MVLDGQSTWTFIQLHPMSNAVQPVVRFTSLHINPCPMFVAVQEPEIQLISDWSPPSPVLPTYNAWNQCCNEKFFFWFLDMLYLQALAIHWTLFCVDSLLLTEDMLCQKLPVACESQCRNESNYSNKIEWFHFWHSRNAKLINVFFPERRGVRTISGIVRKLDLQ